MTVLHTRYRLGSTSYVWPADILPNVRKLGSLVDDVELVLFEVQGQSNLPDKETVAELKALAQAYNLTYTVHLPLDLALAHPPSLKIAEKVIDSTRGLSPWAYVVHLDGRMIEDSPDRATLYCWREDACRVLEELVMMAGDAQRLCIENLENYAPEHLLLVLESLPVSLCVDVGHLWLAGRDPMPFLDRHLDRTRVIHLHGIGERDHQSLLNQREGQVASVLELLSARRYEGVLTLEVFSREDFLPSRNLVAEIVNGKK